MAILCFACPYCFAVHVDMHVRVHFPIYSNAIAYTNTQCGSGDRLGTIISSQHTVAAFEFTMPGGLHMNPYLRP